LIINLRWSLITIHGADHNGSFYM